MNEEHEKKRYVLLSYFKSFLSFTPHPINLFVWLWKREKFSTEKQEDVQYKNSILKKSMNVVAMLADGVEVKYDTIVYLISYLKHQKSNSVEPFGNFYVVGLATIFSWVRSMTMLYVTQYTWKWIGLFTFWPFVDRWQAESAQLFMST